MLDTSRPVFEVGIGTGLIALGLTELGHRVFGVDLSEAMVRRAQTRIGSRAAVADARAILRLWRAADPERRRTDDADRLGELATGSGLRVAEVRRWPEHDYMESPAQIIDKIESRSISVLWDLPDDGWRRHVEPILEELRGLPDPDVPIQRRSTDRVVVLEKPA
jgi:SAM-dependent methyltransferase